MRIKATAKTGHQKNKAVIPKNKPTSIIKPIQFSNFLIIQAFKDRKGHTFLYILSHVVS
jgi:hypothetical protein